jgi:CheY-like chemotaxis protein
MNILRILIAEDSEDGFLLFQAYLEGQPHVVSRAIHGAQAVELVTTNTFDLVFMDINMPVMNGYDATKRIRNWEIETNRPRLPIVFLSADEVEGMGGSGHLEKPYERHELLEAIRVHSRPQI